MSWATGRWRWQASVRKGLALQTLIQIHLQGHGSWPQNVNQQINLSKSIYESESNTFYIILHHSTFKYSRMCRVKGSGQGIRVRAHESTIWSQDDPFPAVQTKPNAGNVTRSSGKGWQMPICPDLSGHWMPRNLVPSFETKISTWTALTYQNNPTCQSCKVEAPARKTPSTL